MYTETEMSYMDKNDDNDKNKPATFSQIKKHNTRIYSMKQNPSSGTSHEVVHILWNPKVNYRVHKSRPLFPVLKTENSSSPLHI